MASGATVTTMAASAIAPAGIPLGREVEIEARAGAGASAAAGKETKEPQKSMPPGDSPSIPKQAPVIHKLDYSTPGSHSQRAWLLTDCLTFLPRV